MNIIDLEYNSLPDTYRADVFPELYPRALRARVENWPAEDQEAFCGIYRIAEEIEAWTRSAA